jgi:antitoxin component YwqK of YwqJK toxin-antitoxin module
LFRRLARIAHALALERAKKSEVQIEQGQLAGTYTEWHENGRWAVQMKMLKETRREWWKHGTRPGS